MNHKMQDIDEHDWHEFTRRHERSHVHQKYFYKLCWMIPWTSSLIGFPTLVRCRRSRTARNEIPLRAWHTTGNTQAYNVKEKEKKISTLTVETRTHPIFDFTETNKESLEIHIWNTREIESKYSDLKRVSRYINGNDSIE